MAIRSFARNIIDFFSFVPEYSTQDQWAEIAKWDPEKTDDIEIHAILVGINEHIKRIFLSLPMDGLPTLRFYSNLVSYFCGIGAIKSAEDLNNKCLEDQNNNLEDHIEELLFIEDYMLCNILKISFISSLIEQLYMAAENNERQQLKINTRIISLYPYQETYNNDQSA